MVGSNFIKGNSMPSLQVSELPENIYNLLQKKARKEHRSLSQEAVMTLAKGLQTSLSHKERRKKLIEEIVTHPAFGEDDALPDPVELLREDRNR